MKKCVIGLFGILLLTGQAGLALADQHQKNLQEPLADITYTTGCENVQIAPFGTSLVAGWGWENGGEQTKFGGDAVYMVSASTDGGITMMDFEVEFSLTQYEPGSPADAYWGEMVYRCSVATTEPSGTCNGSVLGLRDAIRTAAADYLGVEPDAITDISASLMGVYVKAMNPGKGNGRQNYMLADVCTEEF